MPQKYMPISEAADMWNISPRQVQNLCRAGSVPGAVRFGRSWMIPAGTPKPVDGRTKRARVERGQNAANLPMPRKSPFLIMTDLYTEPGSAEKCIDALADHPEAQALFAAEIAYSRGEIDQLITHAQFFLNHRSGFYAVNAGGMLLALAAMWRGDIHLWRQAKVHICEAPCRHREDRDILSLSLACVDSSVRDFSNYPDWFIRGQFAHLPADAHPAAWVFYIKYLLFYAQDKAVNQVKSPEVTGRGMIRFIPYIAEPLVAQAAVEKKVIPEIYLRLLTATAYHQCGDELLATAHVDAAIKLALPDGLLGILAEYRRNLDYLLDDRLAVADPDAFYKYKELHKHLMAGWTKLHNSLLSKSVSRALTIREREIARLAAFGLTNSEISHQLHISVDSVKKAIYDAMNKTGVDKREKLGAFV